MGLIKELFSRAIDANGIHADVLLKRPAEDSTTKAFDSSKHPRGQPGNSGQFGSGGGSAAPAHPATQSPAKPAKPAPHQIAEATANRVADKIAAGKPVHETDRATIANAVQRLDRKQLDAVIAKLGLPAIAPNAGGRTSAILGAVSAHAAKHPAPNPAAVSHIDLNANKPADYSGKTSAQIPGWDRMEEVEPGMRSYGAVLMRTDPQSGKPQVMLREPTGHYGGFAWTWPQGRPDSGNDHPADVAHREVGEETGLSGHIIGHIPQTFSQVFRYGDHIENAYFVMHHDGEPPDIRKLDAETNDAKWVDLDQAHTLIAQTTNHSGRERDMKVLDAVRKMVDGSGAAHSAAGRWIDHWTNSSTTGTAPGQFKVAKPPDEAAKYLSVARPSTPVRIYRSHRVGADHEPYESWTVHQGLADTITENEPGRETLARTVHPSEIVYHADHLPESLKDSALHGEVVVANGKAGKELAAHRGEKYSKGQLTNGDPVPQHSGPSAKAWQEDKSTQPSHKWKAVRDLIFKGFTGTVTASNGTVYHYVDGKRVAGNHYQAHVSANPHAAPPPAPGSPGHTPQHTAAAKAAIDHAVTQLKANQTLTNQQIGDLVHHFQHLNLAETQKIKFDLGLPKMRGMGGGKNLADHVAQIVDHFITHPSQAASANSPATLGTATPPTASTTSPTAPTAAPPTPTAAPTANASAPSSSPAPPASAASSSPLHDVHKVLDDLKNGRSPTASDVHAAMAAVAHLTDFQLRNAAQFAGIGSVTSSTTRSEKIADLQAHMQGFTGQITASNGVVYHYQNGVRVAAPQQNSPSSPPSVPPPPSAPPPPPSITTAHPVLAPIIQKVLAGQPVSAAEQMAFNAAILAGGMSRKDLDAAIADLGMPPISAGAGGRTSALINHLAGYTGQRILGPASATPAAPAAANLTPAPSSLGPTPIPPLPPPGPAAYPPGQPLPTKVSASNGHRGKLEALVRDQLQQMGKSAEQALQDGDGRQIRLAIWSHLASRNMPTVFDVERAIKSIRALEAPKVLSPLFQGKKSANGPNHDLPDDARPSLSEAEKVALQKYTVNTASWELNDQLRKTGQAPAEFDAMHKDMQAAFAKAPVFKQPVDCVRSINLSKAATANLISLAQAAQAGGHALMLPGYTSTTVGSQPLAFFKGNVVLRIKATHGLDMDTVSHYPGTGELLLNHASQFKVTGVTQTGGRTEIHLEQVPPTQASPMPTYDQAPVGVMAWGKGVWAKKAAKKAATATPAPSAPLAPGQFRHFASPHDCQAVKDYISGRSRHTLTANRAGHGHDTLLTKIMEENGKSGVPAVHDRAGIDALVAQGWTVGYRGVALSSQTDQFKSDPSMFNGSGIYGNGTYVCFADGGKLVGTAGLNESGAHSHAKGYGPQVMRIAVPPTAKSISFRSVNAKRKAVGKKIDADVAAGVLSPSEGQKLHQVIKDSGRLASLLGYDVINAGRSNYCVVLNRAICAVQRSNV